MKNQYLEPDKSKTHYVKKALEIGDYILFNGSVGKVKGFPEEEGEVLCKFLYNPHRNVRMICESLTYISEEEAKEFIYQNLKNL